MARLVIEVDTKQATANVKKLDKQVATFTKNASKNAEQANKSMAGLGSTLKGIATVAVGAVAISSLIDLGKQLANIADTYTLIDAKIRNNTSSQEEFNKVYSRLYEIGRQTGSTLEVNAQAFNKLAQAADFNVDDLIRSQEILNKAMVVNGATAEESASFMLQYAQAMGSGVVNGDELRSMNEANALVMGKIAKELGTTIAGLKEMGAQGELTSELFFNTLLKVGTDIDELYGKIPVTMSRALSNLQEVLRQFVADANKATSSSSAIADGFQIISEVLEENRQDFKAWISEITKSTPEFKDEFRQMVEGVVIATKAVTKLVEVLNKLAKLTPLEYFKKSMPEFIANMQKLYNFLSGNEKSQGGMSSELENVNKLLDEQIKKRQEVAQWVAYSAGRKEEKSNTLSQIDATIEKLKEQQALLSKPVTIPVDINSQKLEQTAKNVSTELKAGAREWLDTIGGDKGYKQALEKLVSGIKKANADILDDFLEMQRDLSEFNVHGLTDEEAWYSTLGAIAQYREEAEKAAKAGDWETQLRYLEEAKRLISDLPSEGVTEIVSQEAVDKALAEFKRIDRITRGGLTEAFQGQWQQAYDAYIQAQKDAEAGSKKIIDEQEAANEKYDLTKSIWEEIIKVKEKNLKTTEEEKAKLEETYSKAKELLGEVTESTKNVTKATEETEKATDKVGEAIFKVGDVWYNTTAAMAEGINVVNMSLERMIDLQSQITFDYDPNGVSGADSTINGSPSTAPESRVTNASSTTGSNASVNFNLSINGGGNIPMSGSPQSVAQLQRAFNNAARFAS